MEEKGAISDSQYGFRKGRSTLAALERVLNTAVTERRKTRTTRQHYLVVLLDVRNAFNSMSWRTILDTMRAKGISPYLQRIVGDYLKDREVTYGGKTYKMTAGVPQGSVLGPTLWNLAYNGVLELEDLPEGTSTVAYADDLALVVTAKDSTRLEERTNRALESISWWMTSRGLTLAPEKSEAIYLTGKKKVERIDIRLRGHPIPIKKTVRYLGVTLDTGLTGKEHIQQVTAKADKVMANLARIMPRVNGASDTKRRLLASVADSIVLYAAPVWGSEALKTQDNINILEKTQRKAALRISRAYRTISTDAAMVLAGTIPWKHKVRERTEIYKGEANKKEAREESIRRWELEWEDNGEGAKGSWTRKIIPDLRAWITRKHGHLTYHLTQVLAGHGCFQAYLKRIKKVSSAVCVMCETGEVDDAGHTAFQCPRFADKRAAMEAATGTPLTPQSMVPTMLKGEKEWLETAKFIGEIMREKEENERAREAERRRSQRAQGEVQSELQG
jgi:hypothetical protein